MPSNCGAGEDSWESLGQQGNQSIQSKWKSTLNTHWKDLCLNWSSSIFITWYKQPTHWKSPSCWEGLKAEGEESVRMRWLNGITNATDMNLGKLQRWWETGMLQSVGLERVGHYSATEQQQTEMQIELYTIVFIVELTLEKMSLSKNKEFVQKICYIQCDKIVLNISKWCHRKTFNSIRKYSFLCINLFILIGG